MTGPAAARWSSALAEWAIPDEILAAAPESPWGHPPALFRVGPSDPADTATSPSRRRAAESLAGGGTILDVGVGGGAASLPLCPPGTHVTGVDESEAMLALFAAEADAGRIPHHEVQGVWPAVAPSVDVADVAVCHHVLYNVADLVPFVVALDRHARRRAVVEISAEHPLVHLGPLWRHFWDLERPSGPTADDALAVLAECGIDAHAERWERASRWTDDDRPALVAFTRRRLCLPAARDHEVDALLGPGSGPPRRVVTLWWEIAGPR